MFDFKFDWDTRLELGLTTIDQQRQQLFSIGRHIEQLLLKQCIGVTDEQLLNILYQIRDYITYHFYEEEAFMKKLNFPELEVHCKLHNEFLIYINQINYTELCDNPMIELSKIKHTIVSWIFQHMIHQDQKIATYYRQLDVSNDSYRA